MEIKQKKCSMCKEKYTPARTTQKVCSMRCAIALQDAEKVKKFNQETKERREKLKSKSQWLKQAQAAFNKFIRLRDADELCISCDRVMNRTGYIGAGGMHAGHYRSVGACPELRFEELNVHAQCAQCNNERSGNILEYRIRLIDKIGLDKVEWLEGKHDPLKLSIDEIKDIIVKYKSKCKELK